jgi:amidohydrolase
MKTLNKAMMLAGLLAFSTAITMPSMALDIADLNKKIEAGTAKVMPKVIEWRHDIHANPELGNREFRTAKKVADHLRSLGISVQTGVAHTGVVGTLVGGKPGKTVALRADMDALPVTEKTGLPFASKVTVDWRGQKTGVMHACGHDAHVAILMGVAELLAGMKEDIPGTVKFFFQPAEEGPPPGEEGGATLMVKEGVMRGEGAPDAIFGLHVFPGVTGEISYKPEGMMAAADGFSITVHGKQTHGSSAWNGIDPIAVSAQIINAIQTIPSRQVDITKAPSVVTVGSINGGNRGNIIPAEVVMTGTIRTFDQGMREDIHKRLRRTAIKIAESFGATATVNIGDGTGVTYNDAELTAEMIPFMAKASSSGKANLIKPIMGAEDFSAFQAEVPGLFVLLGVAKDGVPLSELASNHSPYFYVNDKALPHGVKALSSMALGYLNKRAK